MFLLKYILFMINMFFTISLSLNLMFLKTNHPLSMSMILILQTINIAFLMSLMYESFWYSYMMILIILSSIIILFIYMTSLISNMKIFINYSFMYLTLMTIIIFDNFYYYTMENYIFLKSMKNLNLYKNLYKIYNINKSMIYIFMLMYLFIIMMLINKLINLKLGPIHKINDKL